MERNKKNDDKEKEVYWEKEIMKESTIKYWKKERKKERKKEIKSEREREK